MFKGIENIYVCGDTHCMLDFGKMVHKDAMKLGKSDLVIILGDFGGFWEYCSYSNIEKMLGKVPYQLAFISGNHENYDLLNKIHINEFNVGVERIGENELWYFPRGNVYEIADRKLFMFGGGQSIDKQNRTEHISWWKDELASPAIEEKGLVELAKHNNTVDYILAHTCPTHVAQDILYDTALNRGWRGRRSGYDKSDKKNDPTCKYLDFIVKENEFKEFHFGHFHRDVVVDDIYYCHYNGNLHYLK